MLVPFARVNPWTNLYGEMSTSPEEILRGQLFSEPPAGEVTIEPGEYADSEFAFLLSTSRLNLMALRIAIRGFQGRWNKTEYWWGTFVFIDPLMIERSKGRIPDRMRQERSGT